MRTAPTSTAAVIVAAGQGLRAGQALPKQFVSWHGKPVLRHSAERFAALGFEPIVVVIPEGAEELCSEILSGIAAIRLVTGGATRQESVRNGLEVLATGPTACVLIHDAARPDCPPEVVDRLLDALDHNDAAIPVLPAIDSLAMIERGTVTGYAPREDLRRVQTPQAFRFPQILAAHRLWQEERLAGDDAEVARAAGQRVVVVDGDERLRKLTTAADFAGATPQVRTGTGFDVHRLALGEDLWLCGVKIDHSHGLAGHSDADVAIHALVDAILGALGEGDIGVHFPPSDPQWRSATSSVFLRHAISIASNRGYTVGNLDLTIICEAPRIGPHRQLMRETLAKIAGCDVSRVSVKGTTTEGLGLTGRREGIAAQAIATMVHSGD